MRVCIASYHPLLPLSGGSSIRVYTYVKEFCKRGHDVHVIAPLHTELSEVYGKIGNVKVCPINQIEISRRKKKRELRYIFYAISSAMKCLSTSYRYNIDLLISHNIIPIFGAMLAKSFRKIPLVLDLTDILTGFFYFYHIPKPLKRLLEIPLLLEMQITRFPDKIITVSEASKEVISARGVPEDRIRVISDGVDFELFNPKVSGDDVKRKFDLSGNVVVLFMGMIDRYQGVECLVRAAPEVLSELPNAKFLVVGEGTALDAVKSLAAKLHVKDSFIFTGWVPHEDIPKYVRCADVSVITHLPGFSNEILFPVKLVEYWAMGNPVGAPRLKNMASLIEDGLTGMLYEPGNHAELADCIVDMLLDPHKARIIGENAMKIATSKFSWDKLAADFVDTCESVVANRSCARPA